MKITNYENLFSALRESGYTYTMGNNASTENDRLREAIYNVIVANGISSQFAKELNALATDLNENNIRSKRVSSFIERFLNSNVHAKAVEKNTAWNNARAAEAEGKDVDYPEPQSYSVTFNNIGYIRDVLMPALKREGINVSWNPDAHGAKTLTLTATNSKQNKMIKSFMESRGLVDNGSYKIGTKIVGKDDGDTEIWLPKKYGTYDKVTGEYIPSADHEDHFRPAGLRYFIGK